jgi:hypothetical protein
MHTGISNLEPMVARIDELATGSGLREPRVESQLI